MLLFFYLRVLFAKKTTAKTGQPIAMSSNTTLYRRPVTIDEPSHVFDYHKLVFSKYDDLSEPRPQVQVLAMYFTRCRMMCIQRRQQRQDMASAATWKCAARRIAWI
jgi:hypothetical protein